AEMSYRSGRPSFRDRSELGVDEAGGEEIREGLPNAGLATLHLGADGVEIDEPGLEERPRHRLERFAHLAVELDLVVERAEYVGDRLLFTEIGRYDDGKLRHVDQRNSVDRAAVNRSSSNGLLKLRA